MKWMLGTILILALATGCQQNFDDRLAKEAREYTQKHCPRQLDAYTTLDSTAYNTKTRTYRNYLTLNAQTPAALLDNLQLVKQTLIRDLQNDANWNAARKKEINFEYIYRMEAGGQAFTIRLVPQDYNA